MPPIPSEFRGVTAVAKANVYFDGKVVSHTVLMPDGAKKTLGLIYPGSYHFNTGAPERMEIIAGRCRVKLDGAASTQNYVEGHHFDVPGKSGFSFQPPSTKRFASQSSSSGFDGRAPMRPKSFGVETIERPK